MLYRGRLAPSPTGLLHLGHARTFWFAAQRAAQNQGQLILRNEDLDPQRSKDEFVQAMFEDLRWLGIDWCEGPDIGGPFSPYTKSERRVFYLTAWKQLRDRGIIYPCTCSRKDVAQAADAPNEGDDEPVYPGTCRPGRRIAGTGELHSTGQPRAAVPTYDDPAGVNWRFQVPGNEEICFNDLHFGPQRMVAGRDFGDFIVWRRDDVPAYQWPLSSMTQPCRLRKWYVGRICSNRRRARFCCTEPWAFECRSFITAIWCAMNMASGWRSGMMR